MVERLVRNEKVRGSNPLTSTTLALLRQRVRKEPAGAALFRRTEAMFAGGTHALTSEAGLRPFN